MASLWQKVGTGWVLRSFPTQTKLFPPCSPLPCPPGSSASTGKQRGKLCHTLLLSSRGHHICTRVSTVFPALRCYRLLKGHNTTAWLCFKHFITDGYLRCITSAQCVLLGSDCGLWGFLSLLCSSMASRAGHAVCRRSPVVPGLGSHAAVSHLLKAAPTRISSPGGKC